MLLEDSKNEIALFQNAVDELNKNWIGNTGLVCDLFQTSCPMEALSFLVNPGPNAKIDYFFVDLQINDNNTAGVTFLEENRRKFREIPTIIYSIATERSLYNRCINAGADSFLSKGLTPVTFNDIWKSILFASNSHNRVHTVQAEESVENFRQKIYQFAHEINRELNFHLDQLSPLEINQPEYVEAISGIENLVADVTDRLNQVIGVKEREHITESLALTSFNIRKLCNEIIDRYKDYWRRKYKKDYIHISYQIDQDLIIADRIKVRDILRNVFENSVKFAKTGEVLIDFTVKFSGDASLVNQIIEIRDYGKGLRKDYVNRTIESWWKAPEAKQIVGWGIGLSYAHLLASAHIVNGVAGELTPKLPSDGEGGFIVHLSIPAER